MKIFLFGKDGQIGSALYPLLSEMGDVTAFGRDDADFTDIPKILKIINEWQPDIIVNAAAYTAVDRAEEDAELAYTINATAVGEIAKIAKDIGAWFIHYSTDYVFDGNKTGVYIESDNANPINVYGLSKLKGDEAIINTGGKYIILRTSWVYGAAGQNFAKTILSLARKNKVIKVVDDQMGAPTYAPFLARMTAKVLNNIIHTQHNHDLSGVYHLTSKGDVSWYGFAKFLLERGGITDVQIMPISTREYGARVNRPHNSKLDCAKFKNAFDVVLPEWQSDAQIFVDAYMKDF